jgi:hypothetical protein
MLPISLWTSQYMRAHARDLMLAPTFKLCKIALLPHSNGLQQLAHVLQPIFPVNFMYIVCQLAYPNRSGDPFANVKETRVHCSLQVPL